MIFAWKGIFYMVLHLGSDCFVTVNSILMILDYQEAVKNQDTSLFLKQFPKIRICGEEETPKSVIITEIDGEKKMYLSHISYKTLLKRSKMPVAGVESYI